MSQYSKKDRLLNLGLIIRKKREALGKSVREIEQESGVSKTLISQLETNQRNSIPKKSTLEKIEKSLMYKNNELQKIAGLIEYEDEPCRLNWQDELRLFLANNVLMSAKNIERSLSYIQGLRLIQEIEEGDMGEKYPLLRDKILKIEE